MASDASPEGGRLKRVGRITARLRKTEFQMELAVMAIDRWNRLSEQEQRRFRELAGRAGKAAKPPLSKTELKELGRFWKELEVGGLVREGIGVLTRREKKAKSAGPTAETEVDAQPPG